MGEALQRIRDQVVASSSPFIPFTIYPLALLRVVPIGLNAKFLLTLHSSNTESFLAVVNNKIVRQLKSLVFTHYLR